MHRKHEFHTRMYSEIIPAVMMAKLDPESIEACAERLRITREALGLSQAEICRQTKIHASAWNNAETGDNRLTYDNALKLCRRYGLTLDWLMRGDIRQIPAELSKKIAEIEAGGAVARRA